MEKVVSGLAYNANIPLVDESGAAFTAATITYSVADGSGAILVPSQAASYNAGDPSVQVIVPPEANTLASTVLRDSREIALICTLADGSIKKARLAYIVESLSGVLSVGTNTLITLSTADMLAMDIPNATAWFKANVQDRTSALLESYRRLSYLRLVLVNSTEVWRPHVWTDFFILAKMKPDQIAMLPSKQVSALSYGQVSEADAILKAASDEALGLEPSDAQKRDDGLVLETVGAVKKMWRSTKGISIGPGGVGLNKRTLSYIGPYIATPSLTMGRT